MGREERTAKRKATREETKQDKKDMEKILSCLVDRYGTERAALKECIEALLHVSIGLGQLRVKNDILDFLSNPDYDKTEDRDNTSAIQLPEENKKIILP